MNLLEKLREEIRVLGLNKKEDIKDYLYRRTGEIFNYDSVYELGDGIDRLKLKKMPIDIRNIKTFNIICFQWAKMFKDLLLAFDIDAKYIDVGGHAFVEVYLDGKIFKEDLMKNYDDLMRVKFSLDIYKRYKIFNKETNKEEFYKELKNDKKNQKIKMQEVLELIKVELKEIKSNFSLDLEKYIYLVFKTIEKIMNFPRTNIGYSSGVAFINNLLKTFIHESYNSYCAEIFNKDKRIFIEVYAIMLRNKIHYFTYRMNDDGFYVFHEENEEMIDFYLKSYHSKHVVNLSKIRKLNYSVK